MFFFLPVSHDEHSVRRWPVVTLVVAALCLAAHLLITLPRQPGQAEIGTALTEAVVYYLQRPYLEPGPAVAGVVEPLIESGRFEVDASEPAIGSSIEQDRLDALEEAYWELFEEHGGRLGLVPSDFDAGDLFVHIFLHGGWMHLLGNLLFLWMVGPALEDLWGRFFYSAFYIGSGLVASLYWVASNADSTIPMVGASGAIAGLMGAFVVRFWKSRFHIMLVFFLPPIILRKVFPTPTWLLLGLWFAGQVGSAMIAARLGVVGGTAYSVHVAGFVCGLLVALAIAFFGIEKKVFQPAVDRALGGEVHPELTRAYRLIDEGKPEAWDVLEKQVIADPANPEFAMALWNLAEARGEEARAAPTYLRHLRFAFQGEDRRRALDRWDELAARVPGLEPDPPLRLAIAQQYAKEGQLREAADMLVRGAARIEKAPQSLRIEAAVLGAEVGAAPSAAWCQQLLASPGLDEPAKRRLAAGLEKAREQLAHTDAEPISVAAPPRPAAAPMASAPTPPMAAPLAPTPAIPAPVPPSPVPMAPAPPSPMPPGPGAPMPVPPELAAPAPTLPSQAPPPVAPHPTAPATPSPFQVYPAVPARLEAGGLVMEIEGTGLRRIGFDQIQAVAVARIENPRPWLLIDLVLGPGNDGRPRVLRISSDRFDARRLMGTELSPLDAYGRWTAHVLSASGARPLPDAAGAAGRPYAVFADLSEYAGRVLMG